MQYWLKSDTHTCVQRAGRVSFSLLTHAGLSHFLLAIPVPLIGFSVPEHSDSEEVEDAIETMSSSLLFSFLKVCQ